jgi:Flp pilus assembly protein TadD
MLILLALTHAQCGDFSAARDFAEQALSVAPNNADANTVMGNLLRERGEPEAAIRHFDAALAASSGHVPALVNRGLCLQDLGRFDAARQSYLDALEHGPNVTAAVNLAGLQFDLGEYDEAMARIEDVLRRDPDCTHARATRGLGLLRRGDFAQGWIDYDARDHGVDAIRCRAFEYPEWDGSRLPPAALLVCGEQGLGDQIMFASCFGELARIAPRCLIDCDPRLAPLFARSFPALHVYGYRKGSGQPWLADGLKPIARTWIGSLPLRLSARGADVPTGSVYLRAEGSAVERWSTTLHKLGPGLKVGISWRGGTATTRRTTRSIPLEEWLPILQTPQAHFVSLQYGDCASEIKEVCARSNMTIHYWNNAIADFDETAALVCALDLVISVQTSVAHLAGALGRPAWVLVPKVAEWRYGEAGERMLWYRTVRLFRQTSADHWHTEISRIAALLATSSGSNAEAIESA